MDNGFKNKASLNTQGWSYWLSITYWWLRKSLSDLAVQVWEGALIYRLQHYPEQEGISDETHCQIYLKIPLDLKVILSLFVLGPFYKVCGAIYIQITLITQHYIRNDSQLRWAIHFPSYSKWHHFFGLCLSDGLQNSLWVNEVDLLRSFLSHPMVSIISFENEINILQLDVVNFEECKLIFSG